MWKQAGELFPEVELWARKRVELTEVGVKLEDFDLEPARIDQAEPDIVFEVRHCH